MSFEEALKYLNTSERSLRAIIQRSKDQLKGKFVEGPTIRFFQTKANTAIKFRREWLDDFILDTHTTLIRRLADSPEVRRSNDQRKRNGRLRISRRNRRAKPADSTPNCTTSELGHRPEGLVHALCPLQVVVSANCTLLHGKRRAHFETGGTIKS